MTERVKLQILEVQPQKPVGDRGAIKLEFKAKAQDGKDYLYFTFSTRLFEHIVPGATIEADVDTTTRETERGTFTDRKVSQIYKEGQPVGGKVGGGGWAPRQSSPEERASIEAQVAFKGVVEVWVAGKLDGQSTLVKQAMAWAESKLLGQTQIVRVSQEGPKPVSPTQEKVGNGEDLFPTFSSAGDLANRVHKDGGNVNEVLKELKVQGKVPVSVSELKTQADFEAAWKAHLNLKRGKLI